MNMFDELKAWADKWHIPYSIEEGLLPEEKEIIFWGGVHTNSAYEPGMLCFTYYPKQNRGVWSGSIDWNVNPYFMEVR